MSSGRPPSALGQRGGLRRLVGQPGQRRGDRRGDRGAGALVGLDELRDRVDVLRLRRLVAQQAGDLRLVAREVREPGLDVGHRQVPGQRGGVQQRGEVAAALVVPELPVPARGVVAVPGRGEHVGRALGGGHRVGAADQRVERHRRRAVAEPDRVEHEHRPAPRPQGAGLVEQVRAGAGGDHRAGGVDDLPGEPLGLAAARAAEHQHDLLDRRPHRR